MQDRGKFACGGSSGNPFPHQYGNPYNIFLLSLCHVTLHIKVHQRLWAQIPLVAAPRSGQRLKCAVEPVKSWRLHKKRTLQVTFRRRPHLCRWHVTGKVALLSTTFIYPNEREPPGLLLERGHNSFWRVAQQPLFPKVMQFTVQQVTPLPVMHLYRMSL